MRTALALVLSLVGPLSAQPGSRPNVVFVFTDDHATHAVSAYGSRINRTPNLDRLAAGGMLFRNAFVTNSICAPSRAVILTGKHSHRNGLRTNADTFDGTQQTFPKLLRAAGYQTALIGKWHLKSDPTGFDHWDVLIGQGTYYNPRMKSAAGTRRLTGYTTDLLTDMALAWLDDQRDAERPFFLMLQHKAPHREWAPAPRHMALYEGEDIPEPPTLFDDWQGRASPAARQSMSVAGHLSEGDLKLQPPRYLDEQQLAVWNAAYQPRNDAFRAAGLEGEALVRWKYQRYIKDYLRCIAAVDESTGRVLDWLEQHGLADNTVVIYSSDQGFYLGDHGWYDKRWMYEESLRTPLLVRWPGVVAAGSVSEHMVQNLDYAATFLDICGAAVPDDLQGDSMLPLLRGDRDARWRSSIYYHYFEFPGVHDVRRHCGVRTDRYKLIHYYQDGEWELFDLHEDPHELRSAYGDARYAAVQAQLAAELVRLQELYGDDEAKAGG